MQLLDRPITTNHRTAEDRRISPELRDFMRGAGSGGRHGTGDPQQKWFEGLSHDAGRALQAELRQQGVADLSSGGFWVSDEWRQEMLAASEVVNPWRGLATPMLTDTGADLGIPTVDDITNEGQLVAENAAVTQLDIPASNITLRTVMLTSGLVLPTRSLAQDLGDSLGGYLAAACGRRIERRLARSLSIGVGGADLDGIAYQAAVGVTAAATGSITADEIMDLIDSADESWRFSLSARLVCRSATFSALRRLRDGAGALVWAPDPSGQSLGTVAGVPVIIDKNMPTMAAGNRSLLYVDLAKVYIRDVRGASLVRLKETYAANGQVGWIAFGRFGGGLMSVGSVAAAVVLVQAS